MFTTYTYVKDHKNHFWGFFKWNTKCFNVTTHFSVKKLDSIVLTTTLYLVFMLNINLIFSWLIKKN